jgi:LPXTG-motif cell wall-anchored protein
MLKKLLAVAALLVLTTAGVAKAQDYPPDTNGLTISVSAAGINVTIIITAQTFEPGTPVAFTMFSDPIALGTAIADSNGVATLNAKVPASAPAGSHRIEATGTGSNGAPLTVSSAFTVTKADSGGGGNIPRTGSNDTVPVATAGVAVLAAGGMLLLLARRRRRGHAAA